MKCLILIALLAALLGCDRRVPDAPRQKSHGASHIETWHDDQRGVTCWIYGGTNGGISCLPDGVLQP
ncbi:hypothetical protein [Pseudomonas peli]|uniref:hypothetical protein n=1 Tax=Pseudomonas peli TaxID=592361 RepID=UPI002861FBDA|nr:hypothetical protein [Pseudomonas peli]MDR7024380.1 hypothetical protein [Pseudomonas peli]